MFLWKHMSIHSNSHSHLRKILQNVYAKMQCFLHNSPIFCQNQTEGSYQTGPGSRWAESQSSHRVMQFILLHLCEVKMKGDGLLLVLNPPSLGRRRGAHCWRGLSFTVWHATCHIQNIQMCIINWEERAPYFRVSKFCNTTSAEIWQNKWPAIRLPSTNLLA